MEVTSRFYSNKRGQLCYRSKKGFKVIVKRFVLVASVSLVLVMSAIAGGVKAAHFIGTLFDGEKIVNVNNDVVTVDMSEYMANNKQISASDLSIVSMEKQANHKFNYVVKENDTLWDIANTFNVDYKLLLLNNNISESSVLNVGDELVISNVAEFNIYESFETKYEKYTVQKGDTLSKIINKYKSNYQDFKNINGMNDSTIYAGREYIVPVNNLNIGSLTDRAIEYRLNEADLPPVIFENPLQFNLPSKFGKELNSTIWIEEGFRYNIDPLFLMAVSIHETAWFESELYKKHNNVAGLRENTCPDSKDSGYIYINDEKYISFPTLEDGIRSAAYIPAVVYKNLGITTVEEIAKKYAPIHENSTPAEIAYNAYWEESVTKIYNSLRSCPDLLDAVNKYASTIRGEQMEFEAMQKTSYQAKSR